MQADSTLNHMISTLKQGNLPEIKASKHILTSMKQHPTLWSAFLEEQFTQQFDSEKDLKDHAEAFLAVTGLSYEQIKTFARLNNLKPCARRSQSFVNLTRNTL